MIDKKIAEMENKEKIEIFCTGGTFSAEKYDDVYNPPKLAKMLSSRVPDALSFINKVFNVDLTNVKFSNFRKRADSKMFKERDLYALANAIRESDADKIIIVHGSDELAENAKVLQDIIDKMGVKKDVVFTCAYAPVENAKFVNDTGEKQLDLVGEIEKNASIKASDAFENLKGAIEYLRGLVRKSGDKKTGKVVLSVDRGDIKEDIGKWEKVKVEDAKNLGKDAYKFVEKDKTLQRSVIQI
jgi:hypothetical protein